MNDLKTTSVLEKSFHKSTRDGQVSLVSTHDVTNPPVHYCNSSLLYFRLQSVDNIHKQVMKSNKTNGVRSLCTKSLFTKNICIYTHVQTARFAV